jgi:hypothetical protein
MTCKWTSGSYRTKQECYREEEEGIGFRCRICDEIFEDIEDMYEHLATKCLKDLFDND